MLRAELAATLRVIMATADPATMPEGMVGGVRFARRDARARIGTTPRGARA